MSSSSSPPSAKRNTATNLIDLPHDLVADKILSRLPFKEAARTCVLSRSWRTLWRSVTDLDFSSYEEDITISILLHFHPSPIHLFTADVGPRHDYWLSKLARVASSTLHTLTLRRRVLSVDDDADRTFDVCPIAINFCHLIRLRLSNFSSPYQGHFVPFPSLRVLRIDLVEFAGGKQLSMLVSACPLLEELDLRNVSMDDEELFHIVAPKLRRLFFEEVILLGGFSMSAPLLQSAEFQRRYLDFDECSFSQVFGGTPSIEKLIVGLIQLFGIGYGPMNVPIVLENLRFICMDYYMPGGGALGALCLLRSSPNLEVLEIQAYEGNEEFVQEFWEELKDADLFHKLVTVKFVSIFGVRVELGFIKFILAKARVLETMAITFHSKDDSSIMRKVLDFPRVSDQAQILFK